MKQQESIVEIEQLDAAVDTNEQLRALKVAVREEFSPWDKVAIARHPQRPHTLDYIQGISEEFFELSGDRYFKDDSALIGGIALIDGQRVMIIGQEKGHDTESRLKRNFGMTSPEGYRKALRLMQLAEKFSIPIVTLIDTPGAYPGLEAEQRGQGRAIADNLMKMSRLQVPVIAVVIGEGCSGGALGIGVGDVVALLEHAYYSVISPEGCASILWKDPTKNGVAAAALKMHAQDLLAYKMIDAVIEEPRGGAHCDKLQACKNLKAFIIQTIQQLQNVGPAERLEKRYNKIRHLGNSYLQSLVNPELK
jgi:acetyl-CoA carboxylase carboxyl transferase subunit alpha